MSNVVVLLGSEDDVVANVDVASFRVVVGVELVDEVAVVDASGEPVVTPVQAVSIKPIKTARTISRWPVGLVRSLLPRVIEATINPVFASQLRMRPILDDLTAVKYQNPIGVLSSGHTMGNRDNRSTRS